MQVTFMRQTALALLLCLICTASAAAAGIEWPMLASTVIHTVAQARDLPSLLIPLTFAEDRAGFLWAGGEAGLLRFDGYQFRSYSHTESPDDGLLDHYIWVLHRDSSGRLWTGSNAGGLASYDESADHFEPLVLADEHGRATCVWSLDDDGEGGLWVGTNRGLAHLDAQRRIVPPPSVAGHASSTVFMVPERNVEALVHSRSGALWIGGGDGLARVGADGRAIPVSLPLLDGATPQVSRLMEDSAGRIWAGTRHHGAYVVDPITWRARAVPTPAGLSGQDGTLEIMAMEEVQPGRVWLGTFGQGIVDVNAATLTSRAIVRDPLVPGTLDANLIYSLHRDRSGTTWIGTTAALDQFVPPAGGIHTVFGNPARPGGIPADVTSVLSRPDGSVWLASQNDGIRIIGADGKPIRTIPVSRVFCLAAEATGPVYIGARNGLFVASPSGDTVRRIEIPARRPNAGIFALAVAGGAIWLGGGEEDGLWELHADANGSFKVFRHVGVPALPDATIRALALTPGGLLAVGTGRGVGLLNRATGALETIVNNPADQRSIAGGEVESLILDERGRLWVGTADSGLAVMLRRDAAGRPVFHRITTADGLPNADVNRMVLDNAGCVWVSTDDGLAVIDPDSFAVRALKDADGVAISTYWNGSGDRTLQGDIMFGGLGGLTVMQTDTIHSWDYQPPLAISEIHVGGALDRKRSGNLVVPPGANSFAVEFVALDFSAPNRNMYRYKLEGFDTGYIATDARHRVASYTNLPPGSYTLYLQGSSRTGVWVQPTTLRIRILPAWFQTPLFHVSEAVAMILVCVIVVQGRTVLLRRRQVYLEGLVQKRTEELQSSQRKLTQMAYFDPLTALPNRRLFNEALQELLDNAGKSPHEFALVLIDLDGFKRVNDTLGHDAGDAVLVIAGARLRAALREGDFIARLGGDEFAILLKEFKDTGAVKLVCDRVVAGMTALIEVKGQPAAIGASVGAASWPRHGRTADDLYKHADEALYHAKRSGKGTWRWYECQPVETA
jgi:diguanylate cyclase (GGDEF)-like protein